MQLRSLSLHPVHSSASPVTPCILPSVNPLKSSEIPSMNMKIS
uniref:Photosystem II protein N n=1 Tax=Salvinia cucullata TaxID=32188 RepID=A0A291R877_9MONI|nr:photosystem II protein N [Salvinia cucullata]